MDVRFAVSGIVNTVTVTSTPTWSERLKHAMNGGTLLASGIRLTSNKGTTLTAME